MALPARLKPDHFKPKVRRKSDAHRRWVGEHYCSVPGCQVMPIEVAHVRYGTDGAMGMKPSDAFVISLCREHHSEQHRIGEQSFEVRHGISMLAKAREFFFTSPHKGKLDVPEIWA
jgi:hypothetical protein